MRAAEVLAALRARGVIPAADGDRLRLDGPPDVLTDELLEVLAARKPYLLVELAAEVAGWCTCGEIGVRFDPVLRWVCSCCGGKPMPPDSADRTLQQDPRQSSTSTEGPNDEAAACSPTTRTTRSPSTTGVIAIRWARERGWLAVRDLWGEWHEIPARDAPRGWVAAANRG